MIEETLRAEAQVLHDMISTHDTDDFMQRLAVRIAQDAARPPRVQTGPSPQPADEEDEPAGPVAPPPSYKATLQRSTRPRIRRALRRRPTPIITRDPAAHPAAVLDYVRRTCESVLRSDEIDTLLAFDSDYDQAGARTFACLLYTLDRCESALYWWRFAAGAGDPLAAHLLAAHHAGADCVRDARLWRTFARMLGYTPDRHRPQPVQGRATIAEGLARQAPWNTELRNFMTFEQLPDALVRH
ncbi:hypothetical protein AB0P36_32030 [Streptomyces flavidovirens]|uniref:hypothetical protein n=1 Tax=Streptomyces flavidovirens TaxID=67298 RepID=UPI0034374A24